MQSTEFRQREGSRYKDVLCFQQKDFISMLEHDKMRTEKNTLFCPYTIERIPQYIAFLNILPLLPCAVFLQA